MQVKLLYSEYPIVIEGKVFLSLLDAMYWVEDKTKVKAWLETYKHEIWERDSSRPLLRDKGAVAAFWKALQAEKAEVVYGTLNPLGKEDMVSFLEAYRHIDAAGHPSPEQNDFDDVIGYVKALVEHAWKED